MDKEFAARGYFEKIISMLEPVAEKVGPSVTPEVLALLAAAYHGLEDYNTAINYLKVVEASWPTYTQMGAVLVMKLDCNERLAAKGKISRDDLVQQVRSLAPRLASNPDSNVARRGRELIYRYLNTD